LLFRRSIQYECNMTLWLLICAVNVVVWGSRVACNQSATKTNAMSLGASCCYADLNKTGRWRMPSSGMLRCVTLVRADVSEKRSASIIGVTRLCISSQHFSVASYG
jgi:hypothetical protein